MLAAGALVLVSQTSAVAADFYTPPANLSGSDGDVIRNETFLFTLDPFKISGVPAKAESIMYLSRNAHDERIEVTGSVLTPNHAWTGHGERPLVAFAPGTQGLADRCTPSRQMSVGTEYEALFIAGFLARGYAVVVPDYEGLGTPGEHPYINNLSHGYNTLDAIRAAVSIWCIRRQVFRPRSMTRARNPLPIFVRVAPSMW